jgi:hypothetical protein
MKKLLSLVLNDWPGSQNDLQGCENDQKNIVNKLKSEFGFEEIITFKNSQVTRSLFREELKKFVLSAVPGDIIVIDYSGHGSQLIDKDNDEQDGYDEALYLYDGAFSDDEFSKILSQLKEGVICIFIMDSCFSGTVTRDINKKARFKPLLVEVDSNGQQRVRSHRKREVNTEMNHLVLTGCSDTQTSADAFIGGSYNGALTYAAMKELVPGITYREWHKRILKWLVSHKYTQTPQLEGPEWMFDLGVFGSTVVKQKKCWLLRLFGKKDFPIKIDKPDNPPKPPIG